MSVRRLLPKFEVIYGSQPTPYMARAIWGRLRVHLFLRGDEDPDPHTHPWDFWTFPLVAYVEEALNAEGEFSPRVVTSFRWHRRSASFAHRVLGPWAGNGVAVRTGPILTLVLRGRRAGSWGFLLPIEPHRSGAILYRHRFVHWTRYLRAKWAGEQP